MSKIKIADFYYGAALSVLFNNDRKDRRISAALIESDENRQLYCLTTDNNECRLFIKYRSERIGTKTKGYNSWQFSFTKGEINEIQAHMDEGHNLVLALVCGVSKLSDSELVLLDKEQIIELMDLGKDSITISRKKHERAYRISVGGGRENAMLVPFNRFEKLF